MLSDRDKEFLTLEMETIIDEKIKKANGGSSWLVRWSRTWFNYLTPSVLIAAFWYFAQYTTDAKTLQFDDPNQKSVTVNHAENAPNDVTIDKIHHHMIDPGIHMPKTKKDSVYVTRAEYLELIKSNAVDMYNMKKTVDKVYTIVDDQNKTLKAIGYQLDRIEN